MSDTTYTLKQPIVFKSPEGEVLETINIITIKRPKGKEFRAMKSEHKMAMTLELLGACASLPPSTVDMIDADDLIPLMEIVGGFFAGFTLTGVKS